MPDTKDNARNELFYVTTSQPEDESALRLPSNYTKVGLVTSNPLNLSRNMINADDKDSGDGTTEEYGRLSGTVSVSGNRAKDGNAGAKMVRDALIDKTTLYFLQSDNTIGDEAAHGTVKVSTYNEGSDDESIRKMDATLNIQGVPTFFTIVT